MNDPPRRGTMRARSMANPAAARTSTIRLKFLVVGESGIGKTQWVKRAKYEAGGLDPSQKTKLQLQKASSIEPFQFESRSEPTIGVDFVCGGVVGRNDGNSNNNSTVRFQVNLFDMSGASEYAKVRAEFYNDFHGVFFCFDLTSKQSFERLDIWWDEILSLRSGSAPSHILVLGLKSDLNKSAVSESTIKSWTKSHGASYFECSAKSGAGVMKALNYAVEHAQGEVVKPSAGQVPPASQPQSSNSTQQQRPPSASPSPPPPSTSPPAGGGGATNISELSLADLRRECLKRNLAVEDGMSHADLLSQLRVHLARERTAKSEAVSSEAAKVERLRENVLEDVARWARGKDIRAMLNDIHGWASGDGNFLEKHVSYAPVQLAYKKAVVKIHPDKVSTTEAQGMHHLRATEMFKTVNAAFEIFKKANEKRSSMDGPSSSSSSSTSQPSASPRTSPTPSTNPTPRTRVPPRRG